ncbi:single-stranded-DNA-specific exonuclease [Gracilibacillus ureilyticus]|uniref:Single-stranded-DNA-specific exonuclease RecJ n=1 Tax=Gracilibacillus ureilyticus TaxID=531814 RepID=A0A1H9RMH0_9BACI|nr:single-stranded-DNA-specific exonuclease RecJ [Gracilibacillus ureilyticus]SER73768.1 single-stranded-DNA-specific exonuclease [Gracilibacillus ureilyticus]
MLASQSNWIFTYKDQIEKKSQLEDLSLSSVVKELLMQRGLKTKEDAEKFLYPALDQLHDPALFHQIEIAKKRIEQAIEDGESILVYGDYDADGVTSTTLMVEALREKGAMCDYYIPNRFTEGYGPNEAAFREAYKQGFQLIITVDNGIAGVGEVKVANELGMDVIITDHHEVQEELPEALAIIHPKCAEDYPFKELAGVGVAFKFATYLLGYFPKQFLDLVVIGTIADLVPLHDENRVLVHFGLKALSSTDRAGLKALKKQCSLDGHVTEEDIGFRIGPRLNAVGRLQDANMAVDLLLTNDPDEAGELAEYVQELNTERQKVVATIAEEAIAEIEQQDGSDHYVLVVAKEGWNPGVLGIVASKLVQTYCRPAIVLAIDPETQSAKGSARSIDGFDLFTSCMQHKSLFTHFGGHAQAAGMTLPVDNVSVLRDELDALAKEQLTEDDFKPQLRIDAAIDLQDVDLSVIGELNHLAPFGMGNPKPAFHITAKPAEIRQIGATKNHLKIKFAQDGIQLDAIGFGLGDKYTKLSKDTAIEAVVELQENEWNGIRKPQLFLKDLAVKEWQLFDYRGAKQWQQQLDQTLANQYILAFHDKEKETNDVIGPEQFDTIEQEIEALYLVDLPQSLEDLSDLLKGKQINRIYACFQLNDGYFFQKIPSREEFKWLYQLILKRKYFDYKTDAPKLASHKGWKLEKVKFMFQVFHELGFLTREGATIVPTESPEKKDLTESPIYQKAVKQMEVEETLYYSTYQQLKQWIGEQLHAASKPEEEMVYGF